MKKRLLSLLLAMAMIVSMVPFQALAEEPDETPALLEAAEGIAPDDETTEVTIPETTEETVPETTEETVPETTEETVPETTEETVPETTEELVPETTEELVPETTEELVPETTEETISEVLEETVPELSELILPEGEAPETAPNNEKTVSTRIGWSPVNLAMIENGALAGYTFAVDEADADYAGIKDDSKLVLKDITIPKGEDVVVHVTATSADGARVTVEVHVYAATFGIEFFVNDDFSEAVTEHTLNFCGKNSFTLAVKASDEGPLGNVKWTEPSTKLLKRSIGEKDALTYTSTGKTGTAAITVTSRDLKGVSATLTVNVVKVPESFQIKYPSSTRKYYNEGCLLTAGQKLSLSTDLPKDTTGKVTWAIEGREYKTSDTYSLDTVAPEGASADGGDWSAIATIDRNKGVLTTYAGVTAENCVITVRATLTPSVGSVDPITVDLPVLIQPPVESFCVGVDSYTEDTASAPEDVSPEGSVNRKDTWPWRQDINDGSFEIYAYDFQPNVIYPGVKWDIKVSKNVADWYETDDNTIVVTPKAPGKLTFTATSADGSGAKYSGIVEIYGYHRDVEITSAPTTMTAGDKPVAIAAKAYYDDYQDFPIAKPTIWWDLMEAVEVDEDQATDPWGELIDGYFCYEEQYYRGEYTDAATIKGGKLTLGRITKNTKLLLVANCPGRSVYDSDSENWISSDVKDYVFIDVKPANEKALVLAYDYGDYYYPIETDWYHWNVLGGDERIRPVWMDNDGNVLEDLPTDFTYKVSGSACSYDKATGTLTFKKIGTSKLTVSCGGQSVTGEFRCVIPNNTITINGKDENNVITVVGGKSLSLKATGWYDSKTKATTQKFGWSIDDEAFDDKYYEDVYDYCWINWSTGKLTTYPVEEDYYVTVTAECYGEWMSGLLGEENCPSDTVTIHIIPEKTQYRSYAYVNGYNGYFYLTGEDQTLQPGDDFEYWVESYGRYVPSSGTDVISSNPKIAQVVKDAEGNVTGIKIPKDAKPGKVTITVKGQVLDGAEWVDEFWDEHGALIDGHWEGGEWIDAPSAKFTLNVVKPVTDIKLSRPTNKDGSFVPAYVGKSLKLTAKVNSDATNKKLNWGVCYYNGDPEGEFDWELDGDKLEELNWNDNTTVKNGVLKIDKSWYSHGRCYAVFASSQDGNYMSDPIFIQAYAMTGAINIASVGYWPDGERGEYVEYLNNRTVTIKQGEPLEFGAMVSDVTGEYYANPDVTWTISGKKNIVEKRYEEIDEEADVDVLGLKGLNPGTVTIKATAKDGSRKTATFKLVVSNETYKK